MIYIPDEADKLRLTSTFALGIADPPICNVSIASINEISKVFGANILRLKSMMAFPALMGNFAATIQQFTTRAEFEITGEVLTTDKEREGPKAKEIFGRFTQLYNEHNAELQKIRNDPVKVEAQLTDAMEKGGALAVIISASSPTANAFEFALIDLSPLFHPPMSRVLASFEP